MEDTYELVPSKCGNSIKLLTAAELSEERRLPASPEVDVMGNSIEVSPSAPLMVCSDGQPADRVATKNLLYKDVHSFKQKLALLDKIEDKAIPTPACNIPVFTDAELAAACVEESVWQREEDAQALLQEEFRTLSTNALRQRALELGVQKRLAFGNTADRNTVIQLIKQSQPVQHRALTLTAKYQKVVLDLAVSLLCGPHRRVAV